MFIASESKAELILEYFHYTEYYSLCISSTVYSILDQNTNSLIVSSTHQINPHQ